MTTVVHRRGGIKRGKPIYGEDIFAEMKFKWVTTQDGTHAFKIISGKVYRKKLPTNGESFSRQGAFKDDTPINYFLENRFYEYTE